MTFESVVKILMKTQAVLNELYFNDHDEKNYD